MTNRLAAETSPYLQQHKDNPVDWYPWGEEALQRSRSEDKPILLSIGYSACHWCHVMEHESFENPEIARVMNDLFVNIKVDREERPDLDAIYMQVTQAMTGSGGWPMTVFLTPETVPFYAGTYFPPEDRHGHPGFPRVLQHVSRAYREQPEGVLKTIAQVKELLAGASDALARPGQLEPGQLDNAFRMLEQTYDPVHGGFGGAPKFPPAMTLELLLREHRRTGNAKALEMAEHTLISMARGGMYDQIGGGFHRYSVDERWLVPHFEKMLYDNALLARVYIQAFQLTGERFYRRIAEEVLEYVLREMTSPEGAFYSTQDADSEGVEGKFFAWTVDELQQALGPEDGRIAAAYWGAIPHGNWEHTNVLNLPRDPSEVAGVLGIAEDQLRSAIDRIRPALFAIREARIKPGRDEKVLASWNGLMLRAFADAANAFDEPRFRDVGVRNADFVLATMLVDGRLRHTYKDGRARINGFLEDYAYYADGLISLYEATFDERWLDEARRLADQMVELFADEAGGGFFDTSRDHEALISRPKDLYDSATPAANSVAAEALLRLTLLTGEPAYERVARRSLEAIGSVAARAPQAFGRWLCAIDFALGEPVEVAIVGDPADDLARQLLRATWSRFIPNKVVALSRPGQPSRLPLFEGRGADDDKPIAYVCRNYTCDAPTTEAAELARQLQ